MTQPAGALPADGDRRSRKAQAGPAAPGRPTAGSPSATTATGRAGRSRTSPRRSSGRSCRPSRPPSSSPAARRCARCRSARSPPYAATTPPSRPSTGRTRSGWRSATPTSSSRCSPTRWARTSTCSSGSTSTRRRCRSSATREPGRSCSASTPHAGELACLQPPARGGRGDGPRTATRSWAAGAGPAVADWAAVLRWTTCRSIHGFDPPERFVAGTVGPPGQRTFFLQARSGARVVSVALEKQQVAALAERIDELLDEVMQTEGMAAVVPARRTARTSTTPSRSSSRSRRSSAPAR